MLPVNEYRALRTKAFPPDRPPDPPPVDAAISGVDYELTVNGDSASGQARITIDVLKEGWVRIPMPQGLLIREARLDARPVALVDAAGAGAPGARRMPPPNPAAGAAASVADRSIAPATPSLLLSRPGRALLTLDIVVPITTRAGRRIPDAAGLRRRARARRARRCREPMWRFRWAGGFIGEQTKDAKATKVMVFGQGGAPLSLSWARTRENTRAQQPLRLRSTVTEVVGLGEDASQMTTRVQLEVVQGVCSSASLTLPAGFTINEVSGTLVSDWEVKGGSLVVSFLEPVIDRVNFVLVGEFRPPREGRIAVPLVQVAQVERETGGVAVEVLGAGEITRHEARGLDPADPSDLGDALAGRDSPALVAFRYRAHDGQAARSLAVTVSRYTAQAVLLANVEEARYRVLLTEDGKALVEGRFAVRNNQRSFLGVTLPASASLWSASIDRRATRPGPRGRWHGADSAAQESRGRRDAAVGRADHLSRSSARVERQRSDQGRDAGARSAGVAHGRHARLLTTLPFDARARRVPRRRGIADDAGARHARLRPEAMAAASGRAAVAASAPAPFAPAPDARPRRSRR